MLYSHSRIKTFYQCPKKFHFQYIEKTPVEVTQSIEAFMGSTVHNALEDLYTHAKNHKLWTEEELIQDYYEKWDSTFKADEIKIVRSEYDAENYKEKGASFLRDYYKRHHPFNQTKTVGIEQRILLDLGEGYKLQGYIDRLAFNPDSNEWEIHDYKTNANLPIEKAMEEDRQLALYALAIKTDYQDVKKVKLVWHFLAFDTDITIEKSAEDLEALRDATKKQIKQIEQAREFPTKVSVLCNWCQFKPVCPAWKHEEKVKELPENEYLKEEGVVLANKYAELSNKKKELTLELDEELEKVKQALIAFSEREGVEVVTGSDCQVRVNSNERLSFPGKQDIEREQLEKTLKDNDLWHLFSTLDAYELAKYVNSYPFHPQNSSEESPIPESVLKEISKYVSRYHDTRLYVSKKK